MDNFFNWLSNFKNLTQFFDTPIGKMAVVVTIGLIGVAMGLFLTAYYLGGRIPTVRNTTIVNSPVTPTVSDSQATGIFNLDNNSILASDRKLILLEVEKIHQLVIEKDYRKLYQRLAEETRRSLSYENFNQLVNVILGGSGVIDINTTSDLKLVKSDVVAVEAEITTASGQFTGKRKIEELYKKEGNDWKLLMAKPI